MVNYITIHRCVLFSARNSFALTVALSLALAGKGLPAWADDSERAVPNAHPPAIAQPAANAEQSGGQKEQAALETEQPDSNDSPEPDKQQSTQASSSDAANQTNASKGAQEGEAEEPLKNSLRFSKERGSEHYHLANFYLKRWDLALAQIELEVSIMCDPGIKAAHRDFAIVALAQGQPLRALAELMLTVGLGDPIPLTLEERIELIKRAAKTHYVKALASARSNNWDTAITEIQWAQSYTPSDPKLERSLAFCYANKGDFNAAEREYAKTFAMDPQDAYSHADFAFLLSDHNQGQKAEDQLSEALKLAPNVAALHVDLGWLAESKGEQAKAETEFKEAIKLCPKHAGLWLHLGRILEHEGKISDAKDAYKQALRLDSTELEAQDHLNKLEPKS